MEKCIYCKKWLEIFKFKSNSDKENTPFILSSCQDCRDYRKIQREKYKEKTKEQHKIYYQKNKERINFARETPTNRVILSYT